MILEDRGTAVNLLFDFPSVQRRLKHFTLLTDIKKEVKLRSKLAQSKMKA